MENKCFFDYNSLDLCTCKVEPRGARGLEGFVKGTSYRFEKATNIDKKSYVRIYHDQEYYEICSPLTFKQYFTATQR